MKLANEFKQFLREYGIVALALAFIMGSASKDLAKSLVNDIIMPLINPLLSTSIWQEATLNIWIFKFGVGNFISQVLNFILLSLVVFVIAKKILKEEVVKKK